MLIFLEHKILTTYSAYSLVLMPYGCSVGTKVHSLINENGKNNESRYVRHLYVETRGYWILCFNWQGYVMRFLNTSPGDLEMRLYNAPRG